MSEQTKDDVRAAVREQYGTWRDRPRARAARPDAAALARMRAWSSATRPRISPRCPRARTWGSAAATRRPSPR